MTNITVQRALSRSKTNTPPSSPTRSRRPVATGSDNTHQKCRASAGRPADAPANWARPDDPSRLTGLRVPRSHTPPYVTAAPNPVGASFRQPLARWHLGLVLYPMALSLYYSFTNYDIVGPSRS